MIIKIPFGMMFIYERMSLASGLLFILFNCGFNALHILLERKWRKSFSIIYQWISTFLYIILAFILCFLISDYFGI